mmetsp:Transcript_861/g.2771  ORF Transcript_861/g.2771 Transcript_861/m.2771 type:complete len:188 (+) Transcript_861:72-635(+)|eukprot:CAMPEP_0198732234 /NCGR_PEP_ID=MMETSP1475-20131203/34536_1 /TAXON_ID= ORGANISM="Unidentified sp., Strain CCMP1999" /NCGR_SAMPLE_ID=MMETSP1475 /ASSEMBLY_ACC=CAM_ASM_001111 /LENGTH=187 /DNA_ID=CAMNT_0044495301 /DNA_START=54 /DNA_END=617 /DNA_ORIENTATION=+
MGGRYALVALAIIGMCAFATYRSQQQQAEDGDDAPVLLEPMLTEISARKPKASPQPVPKYKKTYYKRRQWLKKKFDKKKWVNTNSDKYYKEKKQYVKTYGYDKWRKHKNEEYLNWRETKWMEWHKNAWLGWKYKKFVQEKPWLQKNPELLNKQWAEYKSYLLAKRWPNWAKKVKEMYREDVKYWKYA